LATVDEDMRDINDGEINKELLDSDVEYVFKKYNILKSKLF
jgi:hypothetical protein